MVVTVFQAAAASALSFATNGGPVRVEPFPSAQIVLPSHVETMSAPS